MFKYHANLREGASPSENGGHWSVYCSRRCRNAVDKVAACERRQAEQDGPRRCDGCHATLDGRRADAAYCSNACRQRAYRQRTAHSTLVAG
jgi:hypothetical protein